MKKYMLGLAALLLMMVMTSAALAGAGDTVERNWFFTDFWGIKKET